MHQADRLTPLAHYIPRPGALTTQLRAMKNPRFTIEQAHVMRREHLVARAHSGMPPPTDETVTHYRQLVAAKTAKYDQRPRRRDGVYGNRILHFFADDRRLAPASRNLYRSAFLHDLEERICSTTDLNERNELIQAMALLIVCHRPFHRDARSTSEKPPKAAKSILHVDLEVLLEALRHGRGNAKHAAVFAEVTYRTGLRPGEWANTVVYPAGSEAAIAFGGDDRHFVLRVRTSKRKGGAVSYRTLRVDTVIWGLVQRHLKVFRAAQVKNEGSRKTDAVVDLIKRTSAWIATTCERLWAGDESRRVTLRSLRSQARANFLTNQSKAEVATVMGHQVATGDGFYAPRSKASLGPKMAVVCSPGSDLQSAPVTEAKDPMSMQVISRIDLTPVDLTSLGLVVNEALSSDPEGDEGGEFEADRPGC